MFFKKRLIKKIDLLEKILSADIEGLADYQLDVEKGSFQYNEIQCIINKRLEDHYKLKQEIMSKEMK